MNHNNKCTIAILATTLAICALVGLNAAARAGDASLNLADPEGTYKAAHGADDPTFAPWNQGHLKCFVNAGCAVLNIQSITGHGDMADGNNGSRWAHKCFGSGTTQALCGYYGTAPSNGSGGTQIAADFSKKLPDMHKPPTGPDWLQAWIDANDGPWVTACALDSGGDYWYLTGKLFGKGPRKLIKAIWP